MARPGAGPTGRKNSERAGPGDLRPAPPPARKREAGGKPIWEVSVLSAGLPSAAPSPVTGRESGPDEAACGLRPHADRRPGAGRRPGERSPPPHCVLGPLGSPAVVPVIGPGERAARSRAARKDLTTSRRSLPIRLPASRAPQVDLNGRGFQRSRPPPRRGQAARRSSAATTVPERANAVGADEARGAGAIWTLADVEVMAPSPSTTVRVTR